MRILKYYIYYFTNLGYQLDILGEREPRLRNHIHKVSL